MTGTLPFVDPTPRPGILRRAYAAFAATRAARFVSRHVNWKLDLFLLKATRGRVAMTLMFPTAILETRGARTGALRRNAVIYWHDDGRVAIAASNAGSARNPGWYHNLVANPDVTLGAVPLRATIVPEDDHPRLWGQGDRVFPAYARYRRDAAGAQRTIPLVQLLPRAGGA